MSETLTEESANALLQNDNALAPGLEAPAPAELEAPETDEDTKPKAEEKAEAPKSDEDDAERQRAKRNREAEDRRWARVTAKLADAERREADLRARIEALTKAAAPRPAAVAPVEEAEPAPAPRAQAPAAPALTQADIERIVEERASAKVAEAKAREEADAFNRSCNRIAAAGEREYGAEFASTVGKLWSMVGNQADTTALIEAALETDKPEALLYHLGRNPADAERLAGLRPAKLGAAVARIAASINTAPAATPKPPVSRAPAPVETVSGQVRTDYGPLGPKNMADWIKWEAEERGKPRVPR